MAYFSFKYRSIHCSLFVTFHWFLFKFVKSFLKNSFLFLRLTVFRGFVILFILSVTNMTYKILSNMQNEETEDIPFSNFYSFDHSFSSYNSWFLLDVFSFWQLIQWILLECWFSSAMLVRWTKSFSMLLNELPK